LEATVDRTPGLTGIIGAEYAGGRNGDEDPRRVAGIQDDRMQAQPTRPRLPAGPRAVAAQSGKLLPRLPAVGRAEQGRVFNAGVDSVRIGERRLEMPHPLELPGMR